MSGQMWYEPIIGACENCIGRYTFGRLLEAWPVPVYHTRTIAFYASIRIRGRWFRTTLWFPGRKP